MSQTTLTSFFNSRKRPASEDIVSSKIKVQHIDRTLQSNTKVDVRNILKNNDLKNNDLQQKLLSKLEEVRGSDKNQSGSNNKEENLINNEIFAKKNNNANIKVTETIKSDKLKSSRNELSLGDIRKKLANSSRLAELKATAERVSKGIQRLQETSTNRSIKEFKSIDVEVPISPSKKALLSIESPESKDVTKDCHARALISPRKVVVSPIKSPSKVPAYIRHAALATSANLPLPHHYRFLAELFRGMETVVSLLYNRNEKITFAKLKPSVQEMLKRNFTEKHLAQIKHLVPDFYNFEILKAKNFSSTSQKETYDLVISPNIPNDIKTMNPSVLLERRRYFYDILLQLVKKHHNQYLSTLDPPMEISDNKLVRWHPEFELEKVPEIECAKLPEMPNSDKYSTAQDVLTKVRELFNCNTKMDRALERLAQAKARGLTEQEKAVTGFSNNIINKEVQTSEPCTSGVQILNPALRNLPAALLEKVKAKQAAKALEAMTRSSEHEQKYLIYSRLPDLARTLRNIFVTERKNVLALNIILSKLDSSFKANISATDLQRDINALVQEIPDWVKLHDIRNTTYLKLDRTADLKKIIAKLEALAEKYKN